jgi:hypothetical protein
VPWTKWTLVAAVAALAAGCASAPRQPLAAVPGDLPPGAGRTILQSKCTVCHDLREVTKFRGYYSRQQWRDIVVTMVGYGAAVKADDVAVLTDYLTESLGRR